MNPLAASGPGSVPALEFYLPLVAALGALLALDETAYGQTWLSQPLPAGILAGALGGDPVTGLVGGGAFQLATLGSLPVGQTFTGDRTSAVVAAVGGAVLAGRELVAPAALLSGAESLGWTLLAACLLSIGGHFLIQLERRASLAWMLAGHRGLRDGRLSHFERLQAGSLALTGARGAALCVAGSAVITAFWWPLFDRLPGRVLSALAWLPAMVVPLGVAALIDLYGWRGAWKWLGGGLVAWLAVAVLTV